MSTKLSRRTFLAGTAAAVMPFSPASAQLIPFKIGLLTVKTGPLAQGGIQMEQGITLFLKEKNYTLAGRKVELLSADTGGNPAGAKTKAQELIERDRVDVVLGPLAAFELLAITDYVQQTKTPILADAAAEDITQRKPNPYLIRTTQSSGQCAHVLAHFAATELKLRRMATISEDFAFGHEQCGAFHRADRQRRWRVHGLRWIESGEVHASLRRSWAQADSITRGGDRDGRCTAAQPR
jgi:branched-chain amino acid transport system substrate-binding protein